MTIRGGVTSSPQTSYRIETRVIYQRLSQKYVHFDEEHLEHDKRIVFTFFVRVVRYIGTFLFCNGFRKMFDFSPNNRKYLEYFKCKRLVFIVLIIIHEWHYLVDKYFYLFSRLHKSSARKTCILSVSTRSQFLVQILTRKRMTVEAYRFDCFSCSVSNTYHVLHVSAEPRVILN